jgi:hypothetical protein
MFRRVRPLRVQTFSLRLTPHFKFSTHRLREGKPASMSVEPIKPFKDQLSVRVSDEGLEEGGEEGIFTSDEEPHFLKPDHGFGFNPLKLGECLQGGKTRGGTYKIVRKLGFGVNSSVWLAKFNT